MDTIWAAYSASNDSNPFGRKFIGYAGWHADATSAHAEAVRRFPEWDPADIQVNRA